MDHTEEQTVEAIRAWWKANGGPILTGLILGLILVLGWQFWMSWRTGQMEEASQQYDAVTQALESGDAAAIGSTAQSLMDDYPKSSYASLAALALAKQHASDGKIAEATVSLEWVLNNSKRPEIQDVSRLRLARLYIAESRFDDAEKQLDKVESAGLASEREELRGDILVERGQLDKARQAYLAASAGEGGSGLLQLKLDNLPTLAKE